MKIAEHPTIQGRAQIVDCELAISSVRGDGMFTSEPRIDFCILLTGRQTMRQHGSLSPQEARETAKRLMEAADAADTP